MFVLPFVASLVVGSAASPISNGLSGLFAPDWLFSRAGQCENAQVSCGNTTVVEDLCCFEHPGGLILQTQFWDSEPSNGPEDSWTIHGLWPDKCDGTYDEFCDPARDYDDLTGILNKHGAGETLDFMKQFWLDIDGDQEKFWKHEWTKHGTCMSTIKPSCVGEEGADAVAYFQATVKVFKELSTYKLLENEGIKPSADKEYTYEELASALKKGKGVTPRLDCKSGNIKEVGWYFNVKGSVMGGEYVLIDAPEGKGSCPKGGIKYPPKQAQKPETKN